MLLQICVYQLIWLLIDNSALLCIFILGWCLILTLNSSIVVIRWIIYHKHSIIFFKLFSSPFLRMFHFFSIRFLLHAVSHRKSRQFASRFILFSIVCSSQQAAHLLTVAEIVRWHYSVVSHRLDYHRLLRLLAVVILTYRLVIEQITNCQRLHFFSGVWPHFNDKLILNL